MEEIKVQDKLLEKIELLRQQMVKIGVEYGLDHPDVLKYSKQIDELHNELMGLDHGLPKADRKKKPYRFYLLENRANFA
nr:aspartyl-phosphate phosphatase Spo0E family protein [Brevibacillus sp. SYP-B805]